MSISENLFGFYVLVTINSSLELWVEELLKEYIPFLTFHYKSVSTDRALDYIIIFAV